ncbi:MAG: SpoIIE family protein phosphatase [Thermodesulfobacteriota bacterium]
MSIRTHLILAFLGIILLLALGGLLVADRMAERSKADTIIFAEALVKKIESANYRLSKQVLTKYGEFIVQDKAEMVAREISDFLAGQKTYDYATLRQDNRLRETAVQNIYTPEGKAGYTILYDKNGENIFHPDRQVEGQNYKKWSDTYPEVWEAVKAAIAHKRSTRYLTFFDQQNRERKRFAATVQISGTPFVVAAVVNIDEFFFPTQEKIKQASQEILDQARKTIGSQAAAVQRKFEIVGLFSLIALCLLGVLSGLFLADRLSQPLMKLGDYAKKLPHQDFSSPPDPESLIPRRYLKYNNEVGYLAKSLDFMEADLREHIRELVKTTAAKERIESELLIAREIQMSILPKIFPPFPHRRDFDIYALIKPAKEVGGDFYDFFLLDDQHFCFVIGDVSDKGVPASLYMAVTKTLIKAMAQHRYLPGEILTRVNRELVSGNTTSMFVTVFLGTLDTLSGRVLYANGGHNPPLMIRNRAGVDFLAPFGDALVGGMEGLSYKTGELFLAPGEALFLYTDGVTEASNREEELFSEERLLQSLQDLPGASSRATIQAVKARIDEFVAGAPQADDITMLMIRFQGRG